MEDEVKDEIERLREDLRQAVLRIDELAVRLETAEAALEESAAGDAEGAAGGVEFMARDDVRACAAPRPMRPFEVMWVGGSGGSTGSFRVYAPAGSLLCDGKEVSIVSDESLLAEVSGFGGSGDVWCNVSKAEGGLSASFSGASDASAYAKFRVATVPSDVSSAPVQHVVGMVSLGGGGEVEVDDVSVGKDASAGDRLELKGFHDAGAKEPVTLARAMTEGPGANGTSHSVERLEGGKRLLYRPLGRFIAGYDTNVTFTPTEAGNVQVDVYWKN